MKNEQFQQTRNKRNEKLCFEERKNIKWNYDFTKYRKQKVANLLKKFIGILYRNQANRLKNGCIEICLLFKCIKCMEVELNECPKLRVKMIEVVRQMFLFILSCDMHISCSVDFTRKKLCIVLNQSEQRIFMCLQSIQMLLYDIQTFLMNHRKFLRFFSIRKSHNGIQSAFKAV